MRILFVGASELGFECCESIIKAGHNVVGIITLPQEFEIKYKDEADKLKVRNYLFKNFNYFSEEYDIPVFCTDGKLAGYYDQIKNLSPDLILVIGWYYMIPEKIMQIAPKGSIGIHASLLPKYRGNAPLVWAIINGETKTGVSLFYFEKGVDEGDIISQEEFDIDPKDTIKEVLEKTKTASKNILLQSLPQIANGTSGRTPQDNSKATLFPKRTPKDGLIDWNRDSEAIRNFIRAQTRPYPGAYTIINGKKVIIWDADVNEL